MVNEPKMSHFKIEGSISEVKENRETKTIIKSNTF